MDFASSETEQLFTVAAILNQEFPAGAKVDLKLGVTYQIMSGWKLWEYETSSTIAAGADGSSFEIFCGIPCGAVPLVAAATTLLAIFVF